MGDEVRAITRDDHVTANAHDGSVTAPLRSDDVRFGTGVPFPLPGPLELTPTFIREHSHPSGHCAEWPQSRVEPKSGLRVQPFGRADGSARDVGGAVTGRRPEK